ncbi:MAG: glutamate racemase [Syntrophothermaceae bacterium]
MKSSQPIGIFDSGVGGLTVVKRIAEQLPRENIIYVGDTAHVPYGGKTTAELVRLNQNIIDFFVQQGAKLVVAACNTSSSVSLPILREAYSVPLLDVISPGVREAAAVSRTGRIGVIATRATVGSRAYTRQLRALNANLQVYEVACPRFVPLVESGQLEGPEVEQAVREYLEILLGQGIDTLVLGCTHYPFLAPVIKQVVGDEVVLVDPADQTARELESILNTLGIANQETGPAEHTFYATGPVQSFAAVGRMLPELFINRVEKLELDDWAQASG